MNKPRSLQRLLGSSGHTARLLEHVRLLQLLNQQFHTCLDAEAATHAQVADLNSGRLVIHADSAAWATRLRYLAPQLVRRLGTSPLFAGLQRIDIRVAPLAQPVAPVARPSVLSADSAAILDSAADSLSDSSLRAALKRLARRGRPKPRG